MHLLAYLLVALTTGVVLYYMRPVKRKRGVPLPPGPRALPLIGNLLDMPTTMCATPYSRLSEQYGMLDR